MALRLLNILLLSVWAAFLVWLLTFGSSDLMRLLHPRLWWVLCVAVVVLVLFLISLFIQGGQSERRRSLFLELPGVLILLVPLLYFFTARDARLDETSLENRIIKNDRGVYLNNLPPFELLDGSGTSEMSFSNILRNPEKYENQDVEIVCQSYVHDELPDNTVMCYRYLITCCAADALPAFVFLRHQGQLEILNNRWVQVSGQLSVIEQDDTEVPSVEVDSLTYVEEPAFPWVM